MHGLFKNIVKIKQRGSVVNFNYDTALLCGFMAEALLP